MSAKITVRILGSGSSGGVPRIGGDWGVCDPSNPKNRRSRCSILLRARQEEAGPATSILIDTSPDMREQLLAANVTRLDAVLITHDHADQTHGLDDLRALAIRHACPVPIHMDEPTRDSLMRRFAYCFHDSAGYPAILHLCPLLQPGRTVSIDGPGGVVTLMPLDLDHGSVRSLGFRAGPFAYCNDVKEIPEATWRALRDIDVFVVDALRQTPHPNHVHLDQALTWIRKIGPEKAVLTNLHIDLDYETLRAGLPPDVEPAYDGMEFSISISPA